jgi:hypothetical protein
VFLGPNYSFSTCLSLSRFERRISLLLLSRPPHLSFFYGIKASQKHGIGDQVWIVEASRTRNNKEKGLSKDSWLRV